MSAHDPALLSALAAFAARVSVRPDGADFEALFLDDDAVTGWATTSTANTTIMLREIGSVCARSRDAIEPNADALLALVCRLSIEADDDGYVEICVDGDGLQGGNGPEAETFRAFGALLAAIKSTPAGQA